MFDEKDRLDAIDKREAEYKALNKLSDEIYESRERTGDIIESINDNEGDARCFDDILFKIAISKSNIVETAKAVEEIRLLMDKHAYMLAEKE